MEFYWNESVPKSRYIRFNSQRDGILPYHNEVKNATSAVSIPNGMEFYTAYFDTISLLACFNSQRDGILPYVVGFDFGFG